MAAQAKAMTRCGLKSQLPILDPALKIIAPVREWEFKSREEEIEYALRHKIPIDVNKKKVYSIDRNLWGVSIEAGILENLEQEPPEDAYIMTKSPTGTPTYARYIEVGFEKGVPVKLDGNSVGLTAMIKTLNQLGGSYGIGRYDMVENRLIGIKSREITRRRPQLYFILRIKSLRR